MSASIQAVSSPTSQYNGSAFWERLWRMSGINFVVFIVIAYALAGFHEGDRTWTAIAAVIAGMAVLNLLWFAAALRTTLADAGLGGWGAAATASSSAFGTLFLLLIASVVTGLNEFTQSGLVLTSFPRAMLIMSGSFGFWRARLISNSTFAGAVAIVVLVLLGGTTWAAEGFWAPDGAYSRFVSPALGLFWIVGASRILLSRSPATRSGW